MSAESKSEIAPYKTIISAEEKDIELRTYESLILVSAPMESRDERNNAFRELFRYISGDNIDQSKIPMTAPVFMDSKDDQPMMSFVMPKDFTLETTPKPTNYDLIVSAVKDHTVAVIRFSGTLSDKNVQKHKDILEQWIIDQGYNITGEHQTAGYNAPYVLPMLRRNEVLIPVKQ